MHRLLEFLYQHRAFFFFVAMETLCFWLIVENNSYQSASFFTTSNRMAGQVLTIRNDVGEYFNLGSVNQQLAYENARLRDMLVQEQQKNFLVSSDTVDFLRNKQFSFLPAKVVNNSVSRSNNFITINKGLKDGVKPNMGVMASEGLVGRVKSCSENFSTIISLLHTGNKIASKIKNKNIDCTVEWDGTDPSTANLLFVVRHHQIEVGDTIVTSEYNAIYPEGIMLGVISNYKLDDGRSDYDIDIKLSTDFTKLSYVYVIENKFKQERDSLELTTSSKDNRK